jgi:hypothetical protein
LNAGRCQQNRLPESRLDENGNDDCGFKIDDATVCHIWMVTTLIEGRGVGLAEITAMLDKILRQHSIDIEKKLTYAVLRHHKIPP